MAAPYDEMHLLRSSREPQLWRLFFYGSSRSRVEEYGATLKSLIEHESATIAEALCEEASLRTPGYEWLRNEARTLHLEPTVATLGRDALDARKTAKGALRSHGGLIFNYPSDSPYWSGESNNALRRRRGKVRRVSRNTVLLDTSFGPRSFKFELMKDLTVEKSAATAYRDYVLSILVGASEFYGPQALVVVENLGEPLSNYFEKTGFNRWSFSEKTPYSEGSRLKEERLTVHAAPIRPVKRSLGPREDVGVPVTDALDAAREYLAANRKTLGSNSRRFR